jgi:two-component system, NtrC family, C4-dicarboxylate transport sensor histidine kinase DctB
VNASTISLNPLDIRANRLDVLGRLADDLAHEIKNPLHAMVINLELIRRRVIAGSAETTLDRIDVVEGEVGRVNRLVDAFLQLLRPGKDTSPHGDLSLAVREILPLMEAQAKLARVELSTDLPAIGVLIAAPRDAVKIVVLNLVLNALDALHGARGRIAVEIEGNGKDARVRIRDSGHGVPAEVAERLGTPGFSTRTGRAGLGLAVSRCLLESAGGRLHCEPLPAGEGACFTAAWPRLASA